MASSAIIQVADSMVSEINAGTWTLDGFAATRVWNPPSFTPAELATLRVTVMPVSASRAINTRRFYPSKFSIDIGIEKSVDTDDVATIDALATFAQELTNYFERDTVNGNYRTPTGYSTARYVGAQLDLLASMADLRTRKTFLAHITVDVIDV